MKVSHAVFKLTGEQAGKDVIINDRYMFVGGEMPASVADAALIAPILCTYYACELTMVEVEAPEIDESTTLNVASTKGNDSLQASVTKVAPAVATAPVVEVAPVATAPVVEVAPVATAKAK